MHKGLGISVVLTLLAIAGMAAADVISIVDYQYKKIRANSRIDDSDQSKSGETCDRYGMKSLNAADLWKYDCTKVKVSSELSCYKNCQCKSSLFRYDSSNCNYNNQPAGDSCNGKYEDCVRVVCPSGSDFNVSCDTLKYKKVVADVVNGRNCYRCDALSCPAGSSVGKSSCSSGYELAAKGYSGEDICYGCDSQSCEAGGYYDAAPSERICSSVLWGGKTCQKCCKENLDCEYGCYQYDTASGANCSSVCVQCKSCIPDSSCAEYKLATCPTIASQCQSCQNNCKQSSFKAVVCRVRTSTELSQAINTKCAKIIVDGSIDLTSSVSLAEGQTLTADFPNTGILKLNDVTISANNNVEISNLKIIAVSWKTTYSAHTLVQIGSKHDVILKNLVLETSYAGQEDGVDFIKLTNAQDIMISGIKISSSGINCKSQYGNNHGFSIRDSQRLNFSQIDLNLNSNLCWIRGFDITESAEINISDYKITAEASRENYSYGDGIYINETPGVTIRNAEMNLKNNGWNGIQLYNPVSTAEITDVSMNIEGGLIYGIKTDYSNKNLITINGNLDITFNSATNSSSSGINGYFIINAGSNVKINVGEWGAGVYGPSRGISYIYGDLAASGRIYPQNIEIAGYSKVSLQGYGVNHISDLTIKENAILTASGTKLTVYNLTVADNAVVSFDFPTETYLFGSSSGSNTYTLNLQGNARLNLNMGTPNLGKNMNVEAGTIIMKNSGTYQCLKDGQLTSSTNFKDLPGEYFRRIGDYDASQLSQ